MGSTGTGKFSDYPGSGGGRPGGGGGGGSGGGGGGTPDKSDKCAATVSLALEDVANSEYFTTNGKVPPVKTKVRVRKKAVGGRIAVETVSGSETVGLVPTAYNYLRACLTKGWEYSGTVVDSSAGKLPKVKVDLAASK